MSQDVPSAKAGVRATELRTQSRRWLRTACSTTFAAAAQAVMRAAPAARMRVSRPRTTSVIMSCPRRIILPSPSSALPRMTYATVSDRPATPVSSHRPRLWPVGPNLTPRDSDKKMRPEATLPLVRWNRRMTELVRNNNLQAAQKMLTEMVDEGVRPNQLTYSVLIDGYARMQKFDQARKLLEDMKASNLRPNIVTYNSLIHGYCRAERLDDALQLVSWLEDVGGDLAPDTVTYSTLINAHAKRGDVASVQKLLRKMHEANLSPNTVTFNAVIGAFAKSGDISEAEHWLQEMHNIGCAPTVFTYVPLLSAHASAKEFDKVKAYLNEMQERNVTPTQEVYVALARALIRNGSRESFDELSRLFRLQGLAPTTFMHNAVIDVLVQQGMLAEAEAQVQQLLLDGLAPNRYTYFPIFMAYTASDQLPSAARIFALMESTPECEPDEAAYLRLATAWSRVGDYAQARAVLDQLHARGKPTVFAAKLYGAIVQGLASQGSAQEAEDCARAMKERGCGEPPMQSLMSLAAAWDAAGNADKRAAVQAQLKVRGVQLDQAQIASIRASWKKTASGTEKSTQKRANESTGGKK